MPVGGQQVGGQAGVEEGQPPPGGEGQDVVGERGRAVAGRPGCPACPGPAPAPARQHRPVVVEELLVEPLQPVQVPPAPDLRAHIAEGEVVGPEEVHVSGQAVPGQHVPGLSGEVAGRDPDTCRHGAEPEPAQPRAQRVPPASFLLGHAENG